MISDMIPQKTRRYDLANAADVDAVLLQRGGPFQKVLYAVSGTKADNVSCCPVGIHVELAPVTAAPVPAAAAATGTPSTLPSSSRTNGGGVGVKVAALSMAWGLPWRNLRTASGGREAPPDFIVTATMSAVNFAGGDCTDAAVGVLQMLDAAARDPNTAVLFTTLDARRLARALALLLPPQKPTPSDPPALVPLSTCALDVGLLDAAMTAVNTAGGDGGLADLRVARHVVPGTDGLCKRFDRSMKEQGLESTAVTSPTGESPSSPAGGELATPAEGAAPASVKLAGAALVAAQALMSWSATPSRRGISFVDVAVAATGRAMNLWTPEQHLKLRGEVYEHYLCADRLPLALFSPAVAEEDCIECTYCHRNLSQACFDGLSGAASAEAAARRAAGACATGEAAAEKQQPGAEKCAGCLRIDTVVRRSQIHSVLVDDDAAAIAATQRLMPLMQDGRFIVGFDAEWHTPAPYPFGKEGSVLSLVQISVTRLPITPKSQVEVILYDALGLSRPVLAECLTLILGTQVAPPATASQVQPPPAIGAVGRPLTDTDIGGLRLGFDIRRDAEIIRFTTGVEIATPFDLQLLEIARRRGDTTKVRSLRGLKRCLGPITALAHLSGAKGGVQMTHGDAASSEIFLQRPLPDSVVEYSVMDAALLPFVFAAMCDELWDLRPAEPLADSVATTAPAATKTTATATFVSAVHSSEVRTPVGTMMTRAEFASAAFEVSSTQLFVRDDLVLVKAASLRYASYVASLRPAEEKYREHGFLPLGILLKCDTDRGSSRCTGCGRDVALRPPYCTVCNYINNQQRPGGAAAGGATAGVGGGNRPAGNGAGSQGYRGGGGGGGFNGFAQRRRF